FLLKKLASALATNLTMIMNASISQSCFPDWWKKANVCAVWKGKGSKKEPQNYRPISIIPILARTFEKAMASQLYNFCDQINAIPKQQFGFRRKSSCELALLSAVDEWMGAVDSGLYVGALAIDLS